MKIEYWKASGSGFPPSLIPALQNIGILRHKKAKLPQHLQHSVSGNQYDKLSQESFLVAVASLSQ